MMQRRRSPGWVGTCSVVALFFVNATVWAGGTVTPIEASELADALAARKGRVVLVNFWATWCRPCLDEIPDLQELEAEYGEDGFDLIAVSLDDPGSLESTVKPFLESGSPLFLPISLSKTRWTAWSA